MKNGIKNIVKNNINEEEEFLMSIQRVINDLDIIDNMENDISSKQREVDSEISDYIHILENYGDNLCDSSKIIIFDNLVRLRRLRRCRNNNQQLVKFFKDNANKLNRQDNRIMLRQTLSNKVKSLHGEYSYRVLSKELVDKLITNNINEKCGIKKEIKQRQVKITKEQLQECVDNKIGTSEIAHKFNVTIPYVSLLKKKYNLKNIERS